MSIVLSDSFDSYAAIADILKQYGSYDNSPTFSGTGGKFGGGAVTIPASSGTGGPYHGIFSRAGTFTGSETNIGAAFWLKLSGKPTFTDLAMFALLNAAGSGLCSITPDTGSGALIFLTGMQSGAVATGSINVCDGQYHWIEVVFTKSGGGKIWVDGNLDCSTTNSSLIWASSGVPDRIQLVGLCSTSGGTTSWTIDDLVVVSDQGGGTTPANFPLGPSRIVTKRPNGDSSVTFGTTTGANHYGQVNETVGSNAQYVQGTSGQKDLYTYSGLGFSPSRITAAVVKSYAENPGAGSISFKNAAKSSTTETDGAAIVTPAAAQILSTEFKVDPNTGAAWTQAGLDAATFGALVV